MQREEPRARRRAPTPVPGRRQDSIRSAIASYIVANNLHADDALPPEWQLCRDLGVGRNALREAIKALEALGILEIRRGIGTFVASNSLIAFQQDLEFRSARSAHGDFRDIRELLDVREALEVGLAPRAVQSLSEDELHRLESIVDDMDRSADKGQYFPDLDYEFHRVLYEPLHNDLVSQLVRVFWKVFNDMDSQLPGPRYSPAAAAGWHRDLLRALRSRSALDSARAMRKHFQGIRQRVETRDHSSADHAGGHAPEVPSPAPHCVGQSD